MKTVYSGGNVLTMESPEPEEAMLVEDGVILSVGSADEVLEKTSGAALVKLGGKTLMPAFIDAHSHISSYAISLSQAPLESAESFSDIIDILSKFRDENGLQDGAWIIAKGYEHNRLREKKHPTGALLDAAFPNYKVALQHKSGHFGVFSSSALSALTMSGRDKDGYLEENDFVEAAKKLPLPEPELLLSAFEKAQKKYASYGIATAQEGMMVSQMLPLYRLLLSKKAFIIDIVGYPQLECGGEFRKAFPDSAGGYSSRFRLGGCKIILDGSPQGRTAWMKTPYIGSDENFGVSSMTDAEVSAAIEKSVKNGWQLLAHCNGDAAAEQFLRCAEGFCEREKFAALRPVMIHAQLLSPLQLPRLKRLGIIPSFFIAHCYHHGDTHISNFGFRRAEKISPAADALRLNTPFTFHQDSPVIEPDMLETVWCAANRITRGGVLLGAGERIPVYDALKAVTASAAFQYGEEAAKGILSAGRKADFIILSDNPLAVPADKLRDIKVIKTYKSGKLVYNRE